MKIILIIIGILIYFLIGFGVLVLRAKSHYIDNDDVAIAIFVWPIVGLLYGIYYIGDFIKDLARSLANKLSAKELKKEQEKR